MKYTDYVSILSAIRRVQERELVAALRQAMAHCHKEGVHFNGGNLPRPVTFPIWPRVELHPSSSYGNFALLSSVGFDRNLEIDIRGRFEFDKERRILTKELSELDMQKIVREVVLSPDISPVAEGYADLEDVLQQEKRRFMANREEDDLSPWGVVKSWPGKEQAKKDYSAEGEMMEQSCKH